MKKSSYLSKLVDKYGPERGGEVDSKSPYSQQDLVRISLVNMRLSDSDGIPQFLNMSANTLSMKHSFELCIGSVGSAYNLENLQSAEVTHILNLTDTVKMPFQEHITYKRIVLVDNLEVDSLMKFQKAIIEACHFIRDAIVIHNGRVLVHCYQGKSRSAAICIAYMMLQHKFSYQEAFKRTKTVRRQIDPNRGFTNILKTIEPKANGEMSEIAKLYKIPNKSDCTLKSFEDEVTTNTDINFAKQKNRKGRNDDKKMGGADTNEKESSISVARTADTIESEGWKMNSENTENDSGKASSAVQTAKADRQERRRSTLKTESIGLDLTVFDTLILEDLDDLDA